MPCIRNKIGRQHTVNCGCCRLLSYSKCSNDIDLNWLDGDLSEAKFLIIRSALSTVLCRLVDFVLPKQVETTPSGPILLCYDDSVRVIGDDIDKFLPLSKGCWYAEEVADSPECREHGHCHVSFIGKSTAVQESLVLGRTTRDIYCIRQQAAPILSLMLTKVEFAPTSAKSSTSLEGQPLLLSCLKRQLIGQVILWNSSPSLSTEITVDITGQVSWTLRVHTVRPMAQYTQNKLFMVLPSTRITILDSSDVLEEQVQHRGANKTVPNVMLPPRVSNGPSTSFSSASQLLVDTVLMVQKVRNSTLDIPRAFLLTGPPGVGKSHAVRVACRPMHDGAGSTGVPTPSCHLLALQGSEIMSEAGHAIGAAVALQRHFVRAAQSCQGDDHSAAVIFLDECDALLTSEPVAAMLAYLLDTMNQNDNIWKSVVVVAATNRIDSIPETLRRPGRFDKEIVMSPPSSLDRRSILKSLLAQEVSSTAPDLSEEELSSIADETVGYVPADLAALVRRAVLHKLTNRNDSFGLLLRRAMTEVGASALRDAALKAPPKTRWEDIAGDPGGAKTALRQAIEWPRTKSQAYQRLGLTPPRGILLYGPPGCAKTSLARAAAGSSGVAFISLGPADVYASSYVGEAEAIVRRTFSLARSAAPCILFFDEIDAILGAHVGLGGQHHEMTRGTSAEARVVSTFLNEMDGVDGSLKDGVLVLGATNRPWTLDAALMRPGRFDKIIHVPPPDFEGRRSILGMQCADWTLDEPLDLDDLAGDDKTGNMTGAEIIGACRSAGMKAIREAVANPESGLPFMKLSYLLESLKEVKPLLSDLKSMEEFRRFESR